MAVGASRPGTITRRRFGAVAGGALASLSLGACALETLPGDVGIGRLEARPKADARTSASGTHALELGESRDAVLHLPPNISSGPVALVVLFHGAGSAGERLLDRFTSSANAAGVAVLAPDSRGSTWDAIRAGFGRDVAFLDRALERVFASVAVDPERLAAGGFSDGATYALSLGLVNGDLFRQIVAFSPGFVVDGPPRGKPGFSSRTEKPTRSCRSIGAAASSSPV